MKNCGSVLRALGGVRSGSVLRARAGELHGSDAYFAEVIRLAADLDLRDSRNHLGHADGDEQFVGPGVALEEDVGAANVCGRRESQDHW